MRQHIKKDISGNFPDVSVKSFYRQSKGLKMQQEIESTLYIHGHNAETSLSGNRLITKSDNGECEVPLDRLGRVVVYGRAKISPPALQQLMKRRIGVTYLSLGGRFIGRCEGDQSWDVELRRNQYELTGNQDSSLTLSQAVIGSKIRAQRTVLLRAQRRNRALPLKSEIRTLRFRGKSAAKSESIPELLGHEGSASRSYISGLVQMVDELWGFSGRNRRPPTDPVNCLMSFGYSLLLNEVIGAIYAAGMDPSCGFLHTPEKGRASLALDLMEEYRPILADSIALSALNNRRLTGEHFEISSEGDLNSCLLTDIGRKKYFIEYERRLLTETYHAATGRYVTHRQAIHLQADHVANLFRNRSACYVPVAWA